jgi:hypothetical protein
VDIPVLKDCAPARVGMDRAGSLVAIAFAEAPAVLTEPNLRRKSPENGNIRSAGRRLLANSFLNSRDRERRERLRNCESPPLAALSATLVSGFSDRGPSWLARKKLNHHFPRRTGLAKGRVLHA